MLKHKNKNYLKGLLLSSAIFGAIAFGGSQAQAAEDAASKMVNPEDKVLVGYWHNWASSGKDGYKGGTSANFDLSDVQDGYNVVDVSFMKSTTSGGIPTFKPYNKTDSQFRAEVAELNAEGKTVLIALGGADAHIELTKSQEDAFVKEIIRLVDTYGFDGLDIDLEQAAIDAADNQTVIPSALRKVKEHYREKGQNFMITMAPEFPYLTTTGKYAPYIKGLEGYYDFINPQYYNQGGDGFWSSETNGWVSQSDDSKKEIFLYGLTKRLVTGTDGWVKIPAEKFVIGIPANRDAAATGYVVEPAAVKNAMDRLEKEGHGIKGLMTWSANWDAGKDANGRSYNNSFVNTYAPMLFNDGGTPELPDTEKPSTPSNLRASETTKNSTKLTWTASTDNKNVKEYIVYRNNTEVGRTSSTTFTNTNLQANTEYTYTVAAVDGANNVSDKSAAIQVKTLAEEVTDTQAPSKPTITVSSITPTGAQIKAQATDNKGVASYEIKVGSKTYTSTTGTQTITNLQANTTYTVEVIAVDAAGNRSQAGTTSFKTAEAPTEITGTWDAKKVYLEGDRVTFNGKEYQAKWWTQGNRPDQSGANGPWKEILNENDPANKVWSADRTYLAGSEVTYNGHTYKAKWWTQGDRPDQSGAYGVWAKIK